jgi:hypothetical protein
MNRVKLSEIRERFCSGSPYSILDTGALIEYVDELHAAIRSHRAEVVRMVGTANVGMVHKLLWAYADEYARVGD